MRIVMNGQNQFERQVWWSDVFHYVEDLRLYLLLKIVEIVKDGVPFKEIMLNLGQYVRTINLLWEGLWVFKMKKRNFYSHYRTHSSIKRLEKLGLITAELLPHGFCLRWLVWRSLLLVESWLKWKRQVQSRNSLKTDRIFFSNCK